MRDSPLVTHLKAHATALEARLPGASNRAIQQVRQSGVDRFFKTGLPKITNEAWKYTNIRPMDRIEFRLSSSHDSKTDAQTINARVKPLTGAHRLVLIDGWYAGSESSPESLPEGIEIYSLAEVFQSDRHPKIVDFSLEQLKSRAAEAIDGFAALSVGLAADGFMIRIKRNAHIDKPIEILSISQKDASERLSNANSFIYAESGSRVQIVERFESLGETNHLTSASVALHLEDNVHVDHYRIQNESESAFHIGSTTISQDAGSRYRIFSLSSGALISRHEIRQSLDGEGSHCELKGVSVGHARQHIDNYTTVAHTSPGASSDEFYKGILNDNARSVFHGRIVVHKGAQHTDAQQQNRNLLLSPNAEADTKPQLEIYADDVKCSHGATVGQLDENAVFYLRARGLDEITARQMLTQAFAVDMIDKIELEPVREQVTGLVYDKLSSRTRLKEAS